MDIAATSLFAQQQAMGQLQTNQALLKANVKQDQKIAAILAQAVESAPAPSNGRGTNLDISV